MKKKTNKWQDQEEVLYRWIVAERVSRKINQTDMGKKLALSQQSISRKENEHGFTTLELIQIFTMFDADGYALTHILKVGE